MYKAIQVTRFLVGIPLLRARIRVPRPRFSRVTYVKLPRGVLGKGLADEAEAAGVLVDPNGIVGLTRILAKYY